MGMLKMNKIKVLIILDQVLIQIHYILKVKHIIQY